MVFGYDLLCDLLEMLNLINIGSVVATRRNLVDPIERPDFIFFHLFFIFMRNFFRRIFQYYPLSFLQLIFFKFQNKTGSVFSPCNGLSEWRSGKIDVRN
jgi:hypothetical protein